MDPKLRAFATSLLEDDKQKRLKNVRKLKTFVSTNSETFEKADYFKLWEALFFALWSTDTPTLQRQVGCDFCQLTRCVPYDRIEVWMDAFWFVLQREWDKLDRYRIDKFHLFMRMFLAESFQWVKTQNWKDEAIQKLTSSWLLGPLKKKKPGETYSFGVAYHLAEALMEELNYERKTGDSSISVRTPEMTFTNDVLIKILLPFLHAFCYSDDKILANKIQQHIFLSLDPTVDGEIEAIGEWLFEKAANAKTNKEEDHQLRVQRVFEAIQGIDTALSAVGRKIDYTTIIERIKEQQTETTNGMSITEMTKQSKREKQSTKNTKRRTLRKVETKVYTTRRKRITKNRRVRRN